MNAKRKGNRDEHRSKRILETAGYAVTRLIGAKGL
jgi:Holliday junction resolvase